MNLFFSNSDEVQAGKMTLFTIFKLIKVRNLTGQNERYFNKKKELTLSKIILSMFPSHYRCYIINYKN